MLDKLGTAEDDGLHPAELTVRQGLNDGPTDAGRTFGVNLDGMQIVQGAFHDGQDEEVLVPAGYQAALSIAAFPTKSINSSTACSVLQIKSNNGRKSQRRSIAEKPAEMKEITEVYSAAGRYDSGVIVKGKDSNNLEEFVNGDRLITCEQSACVLVIIGFKVDCCENKKFCI